MAAGRAFVVVLFAMFVLTSCNRPKTYTTEVEIVRISPVRRDDTGKPLTTDLEISYVQCPGEQIEVIRGGEDFSSCVAKSMKVKDRRPAVLVHGATADGNLDSKVHEVGGCKRPPDPNDEASYDLVRDCSDWKVNGVAVGFQCDYSTQKALVAKCPWFRKH